MKGKPFKESAFGKFLTKNLPDVADIIGDKLPDAGVMGIVKRIISKREDISPEVKAEFDKLAADHEREMYALEIDDRKDARAMFTENSELQKIFAITFLAAYIFMTVGLLLMIYVIAVQKIQVPEWAIGSISAIWGGMSTKIGTITDFLFGSSFRHKQEPNLGLRGK